MMKISKPILTNEFLLSPVQFTSLNSIVFKNVKNVYEGSDKISLEYEHSAKIEPSSRDWIGIFPRGWSTLQQYLTFEWVSQSLPTAANEQNKENGDLIRRTINFCPKYHMNSANNTFYQFVYVSKQIEVLGVSSYFRFDTTANNSDSALELECLVPVSSKLRSTSVSDFGLVLTNNISSSTSIDGRTFQTNSIHSLQNMDADGKNWTKPQIPIAEVKKTSIFPRKSTGTGDALDPYSSHSEPVFPMSFQMSHCKKCFHFKRGGEFLRSQQVLQSKVGPRSSEEASEISAQRRIVGLENLSRDKLKIVMERNKVLEERVQEMKKEMERLQAESKKIKMSFYSTNKEKVAYEKFVKDFIKSLEKDSIVRVVNGNTEILVKKVNYVGMEEHPRDKKTSKRERELKAVIGLQEITIRNLINSLQEKAKSVQELNQTVKLAQVFSASREDTRDYSSDVEDNEEVSNSDVASEYEFSLTKPPPPEEVTVQDTDAVLDDIRRATEMELKDIGISRSLGKSSSRDSESESGLPNLSVRSYQNQSDSTKPKKPRLFDNSEDCWPYPEDTNKTVHRKVIESCPKMEDEIDGEEPTEDDANQENNEESDSQIRKDEPTDPVQVENDLNTLRPEVEEITNYENYYDACEAFNASKEVKETTEPPETEEMTVVQEKVEEEKKENKNFLVTAIIPQNLDEETPATKPPEDWMRVEKEELVEKQPTTPPPPEKGQKFMCELSIDFAAKVRQSQNQVQSTETALENGNPEDVQNQDCDSFEPDGQANRDAPLLTFRKSNKCLEIQITPVDQKENPRKNFVHQKMVVKFGKDSQGTVETAKSSKLEFNVAVSGLGENTKLVETKPNDELQEIKSSEGQTVEMDVSPRTVWNDASEDFIEDNVSVFSQEEITEIVEEKQEEILEEPEGKTSDDSAEVEQDSLRYEKNLEFLQQKTDEKIKDVDDTTKDKPTAILIQNGQTKLALIRYQ